MNSYKKAFTLIELLVVFAIIAILLSIVLESTTVARANARDDRRVSDMREVQVDLAQYYSAERSFPNPSDVLPIPAATDYPSMLTALKSVLTDTGDLPLTDPSGVSYVYTSANGTTYCIAAKMERTIPSDNTYCYAPGGEPTQWYSQLPPQ